MKQSLILIILIGSLLLVALFAYLISSFKLFEVTTDNKALVRMNNAMIHIDYLPGNATAQDNMQVRVIYFDGRKKVLKNVEGFSSVESVKKIDENKIVIIFADSNTSYSRLIDTIVIPPN